VGGEVGGHGTSEGVALQWSAGDGFVEEALPVDRDSSGLTYRQPPGTVLPQSVVAGVVRCDSSPPGRVSLYPDRFMSDSTHSYSR